MFGSVTALHVHRVPSFSPARLNGLGKFYATGNEFVVPPPMTDLLGTELLSEFFSTFPGDILGPLGPNFAAGDKGNALKCVCVSSGALRGHKNSSERP